MTQLKFYKFAAIGMLLLNVALIAFFLITKPPHHKGGHPSKTAKDLLQFDKEQHNSFIQLAEQHKELMRGFNEEHRNVIQSYFNPLINDAPNLDRDSILIEVQDIERKKIESIDQHFKDIKGILKPEQEKHFKPFVDNILKRILSPHQNRGHSKDKKPKKK